MEQSYFPTVIMNQPLPLLGGGFVSQPSAPPSNSSNLGTVQPLTIPDNKIPEPIIARDVAGMGLNTLQNTISNPFTVNRIGQLTAGHDGSNILDLRGVRSNTQFKPNLLNSNTVRTSSNVAGWDDVPGSSFTIIADREVTILFSVNIGGYHADYPSNGYFLKARLFDDFLGFATIALPNIAGEFGFYDFTAGADASGLNIDFAGHSWAQFGVTVSIGYSYRYSSQFVTIAAPLTVAAGAHNYKLQFGAVGGNIATLSSFLIYTTVLGT